MSLLPVVPGELWFFPVILCHTVNYTSDNLMYFSLVPHNTDLTDVDCTLHGHTSDKTASVHSCMYTTLNDHL